MFHLITVINSVHEQCLRKYAHSSINLFISFIHLFIYLLCASFQSSINSFYLFHPLIHSYHSFHPFVHSFVRLCIHSFIHSFDHSLFHSFIFRSSIHSRRNSHLPASNFALSLHYEQVLCVMNINIRYYRNCLTQVFFFQSLMKTLDSISHLKTLFVHLIINRFNTIFSVIR